MGMTIDDAKLQLSMQKFYVLGKDYEAVQVAIDTMHKYQRIEKIINGYDAAWELHNTKSTIDEIRKVIEDGNDRK